MQKENNGNGREGERKRKTNAERKNGNEREGEKIERKTNADRKGKIKI